MSDYLSCQQTAKLLGVSRSTVKRMCDGGEFASVRTPGGHRRIPAAAVKRWIGEHGLRIDADCGPKRRSINLSATSVVEHLRKGEIKQLFEKLANKSRGESTHGRVFDDIIAPAMWEVGDRWERGEMDVFEEHLCTQAVNEVLRQVKQTLDETITPADQSGIPPIAIGCAVGGEMHEVASAMIEIVLRQRGWSAHSLGSIIPVDSLIAAINDFEPQLVWISYTCIQNPETTYRDSEKVFAALKPNQHLVIGGQALTASHRRNLKFHFMGDSLDHVIRFSDLLLSGHHQQGADASKAG